MKLPWRRSAPEPAEERNYTTATIDRLTAAVAGTAAEATKTAVVQAAAGLWGRAFASATLTPQAGALAYVTRRMLHDIGRALILQGAAVYTLDVTGPRPVFVRAADWDVLGGVTDWRYRLTLPAPSGTRTVRVAADGVIHPRINCSAAEPWAGCSPVDLPAHTAAIAAAVEKSTSAETKGVTGYLIPAPTEGLSDDDLDALKVDIGGLDGDSMLAPSMQRGWGDQGGTTAPSNWNPRRLGANPPEALVRLRTDVAVAMTGACGVPPELLAADADGTGRREAWRQFLHGSVQPVGELVAEELADKLELPVRISFDELYASDVQGRGRAYASLVAGRMRPLTAARMTGFDGTTEDDFEDPAPAPTA